MKYSLANYIVTITPPQELGGLFNNISIGGNGSYTESITVNMNGTTWDTQAFSTGGWVHNKNLDLTGTVDISISQLANECAILTRLYKNYYSGNENRDYSGFTIALYNNASNEGGGNTLVCQANDCYITKLPQMSFGSNAANITWSFTCGQIIYN